MNKYDGRVLIDEVQVGRKAMIEKRVVIGVIWVEDEPGYDAPQYVLRTDLQDRAQRSQDSVENYLISVETLQTIVLNVEDEIANSKIMSTSATTTTAATTTSTTTTSAAFDDDIDKDNSVPAWARNTNFKKSRKPASAAGGGGKRKK